MSKMKTALKYNHVIRMVTKALVIISPLGETSLLWYVIMSQRNRAVKEAIYIISK